MGITREDVLTVNDVAALLELKPYTVKEYARRGILPGRNSAAPGDSYDPNSKKRSGSFRTPPSIDCVRWRPCTRALSNLRG